MPVQWEKAKPYLREKYLEQYHHYKNYSTGSSSLQDTKLNIDQALKFILGMNKDTCKKYVILLTHCTFPIIKIFELAQFPNCDFSKTLPELMLRGDISFGAEEFFENEAKMATRLANFISAFLQVSDPLEVYSGKRVADRPLTEDQMIGETLALVLGDTKIWTAGTFWDRNKFTNRTFFAPYAYKTQLNTRNFKLEDLARLNKTGKLK